MSASLDELRRAIGYSAADEALLSGLRVPNAVPLSDLLRSSEATYAIAELAAGRARLVAAVEALALPDAETAILALHRRVDLALVSEAHRTANLRAARTERLALFGQIAASIGHELRNPLGVIGSSLYLIRAQPDDIATREKHLRRIGEQAELATQIIADLLALIDERNARPGNDAPFSVDGLLTDAVSGLGTITVSIECEDVARLPLASGDRGQLRQALRNLLDNACRAARTKVNVRARELPDAIEIVVDDDGPGIDPAVAPHLFEPLQTARPGGLGLGLALVRHIAERNGGRVRNEPQPTGARFVLRMRRAEPA